MKNGGIIAAKGHLPRDQTDDHFQIVLFDKVAEDLEIEAGFFADAGASGGRVGKRIVAECIFKGLGTGGVQCVQRLKNRPGRKYAQMCDACGTDMPRSLEVRLTDCK